MNTEDNVIETKRLRVELDTTLQNLKKSELNRKSRERSLAVTKIQEGIMWLGMDLKAISDETNQPTNPYPNSYNPTNAIVDKTADGLKL